MESCGSGIKRRCIFDVLKEQQGGHREEELELRLGLGLGLGAGTDDDMKMEQLASSSSVVLCGNTSIPHHSPPGLWFSLRPSANR